jgi:hypothetical protein
MTTRIVWVLVADSLAACGGPKECVLGDASSCPSDQACEQVSGRDKPLCFAPVTLSGKVFNLNTSAGIADAEVMATDINGAAAGNAVRTAADGTYTLRIPSARADDKGTPIARSVKLRAQAKDFYPFPSGSRVSLPIDTTGAAQKDGAGPWIVASPLTDVGLGPVPAGEAGRPSISGTVEISADQKSVLLVLESGGQSTVVAGDGHFTIFNVPGGGYKLNAYSQGVNYTPVDVQVQSSDVTGISIKKATGPTATLSGSVQLVAGANGDGTSVVLVVESTFIESLGRGEVPPGLRAPAPGTAPNITGAWSIGGIPDGKYVVLAAFENDGNVRDPDPGISGTQIVHITVANGTVAASPQFKVTGAVGLVGPGKDTVENTTATPTFTWQVYSNADAYVLTVFDALGQTVWTKDIGDKATVSVAYAGPALTVGQYYQWRVTALRRGAPTSMTEELRGLFRVQ